MNHISSPQDKGLGWVVAQVVLMCGCIILGWFFPGQWPAHDHAWSIALILALLGAVFGIAGVWALKTNRTIYPEPLEGSRLIRHGIYRYVRHPLYSSVMLVAFAWAIWHRSPAAFGAATALVCFLWLKSSNEEKRLVRRFPEYAAYRETARRFLPWLI